MQSIERLQMPLSRPYALLLVNRRASRLSDHMCLVLPLLSERLNVKVHEVDSHSDIEDLMADFASAERIIVAGGDGTLHRLLPLLLSVNRPVAVIPLGTANDFARSIGTPLEIEAACAVAANQHARRIDVGRVNGRPFLNVASVGVAAAISKLQSSERKRIFRVLSYAVSLPQAIVRSKPLQIRVVTSDGTVLAGSVLQVSIGNGRYHGGGLISGPDATIDDGLLHIYTVAAQAWWRLIAVVPALLLGFHHQVQFVKSIDTVSCTLHTHKPTLLTVDGELMPAEDTFEFSVLRDALCVLSPKPQASPSADPNYTSLRTTEMS